MLIKAWNASWLNSTAETIRVQLKEQKSDIFTTVTTMNEWLFTIKTSILFKINMS